MMYTTQYYKHICIGSIQHNICKYVLHNIRGNNIRGFPEYILYTVVLYTKLSSCFKEHVHYAIYCMYDK